MAERLTAPDERGAEGMMRALLIGLLVPALYMAPTVYRIVRKMIRRARLRQLRGDNAPASTGGEG